MSTERIIDKANAFIGSLHSLRMEDDHEKRYVVCFVAGYEQAAKDLVMENNQSRSLLQVEEFHIAYGHPVLDMPTIPAADRAALRIKLLREELKELEQAIEDGNLIESLDALADLQYVLDGTVLEFGAKEIMREISDEVHRSNMSKLGEDGKPITGEDGKTLKGPNFIPPDIKNILLCFAEYQPAKEDGEIK